MRIMARNFREQLPWIAAVALFAVPIASAQQTNDLQQQLQQLKQQYEETSQDLQQRIAALEKQIEEQKEREANRKETTISAAELAAQEAVKKVLFGGANEVGAKFQGQVPSRPTYDLLQEAETKLEG